MIDQDGQGVAKAEIVVRLTGFAPNPIMNGLVEDAANQARFSVFSNAVGDFLIQVPQRFEQLTVEAINVPDHEWAIDWAWTLGPPHNRNDNRVFKFAGKHFRCDVYLPQQDRPALFPVQRKGSTAPTTRPSRGGVDLRCDGSTVRNEPHALNVPSTGPSAPNGNDAVDAAIHDYLEQRNAAETKPSN